LLNIENDKTPFSSGKTKVYHPNIVGKRLLTQSGLFAAHKFFLNVDLNRFIPFESNADQKDNLFEVRIPEKLRSKFIEVLNTCGVNATTVFPELDGLCKHRNWSIYTNKSIKKQAARFRAS
jgi:hypothetical protein